MFIHVVLFWFADGIEPAAREQLKADGESLLAQIPGVRHVWAGFPAMTPRPVVDNSYHVALCVVLNDSAAHDVYQTHEKHLQFIARNKSSWTRIQVYDFQ